MSRDVFNDIKKFTDKPATFSPHPLYDNYGEGVDKITACKKLGLDANEKYLLFFGFIRKYKGLDILLEAMADQRIKDAGIKLMVAGEFYGDREEYNQIIAQHNLQDQLRLFTEFIPNEEIKYYFGAADVVVQPYRSATQSGIAQIAYHFEKPMIVTNVGGLQEVVAEGKTGFVTTPDPKPIADAILKFYQPDSLPSMHEHIKEEKKQYSWDRFISNLLGTAFPASK